MLDYNLETKLEKIRNEKDAIKTLMEHSFESFLYSIRTGEFNYALAKELGYSDDECELYLLCGMFHDVGKIGMPKFLIDYPGRYDKEMQDEMKKHTLGGAEILNGIKASFYLEETARYHHCNFDGTGYTYNIKGEEIPFHARLTRVSDSADAYLSTRSYKIGYDVKGLYEDLKKYSGTWYDPEIILGLKNMHEKTLAVTVKDNGEVNQDNYMTAMKKIYGFEKISEKHFFDIAKHRKGEK